MSDLPPVIYDLPPKPEEPKAETCPLCGSEMIKNEKGKLQCPNEHYHKLDPENKKLYKEHNYFGQIRENVKSTVTRKGETFEKPTVKCERCEGEIDLNRIIDLEGGVALAMKVLAMEKFGELRKEWQKLQNKRPKLDLYTYEVDKQKLFAQFQEVEIEGASDSHTTEIQIRCYHCNVPFGKVKVDLEVTAPSAEAKQYTWDELYQSAKKIPKEVAAKVAHELGYTSFDSLTDWADIENLEKLTELTAQFKTEFDASGVSGTIGYDLGKALSIFLSDLPREANRRKQVVIEKIQEIALQEAARR